MALDKFGNIYVTGLHNSGYCIIKYNPAGVQQWVQVYTSAYNGDDPRAISVDDSCNVYVTGGSFVGFVGQNEDWNYTTVKYNTNGVLQWARSFEYYSQDYSIASCIAVDENENVYVSGYYGFITVKYDLKGTFMWVKDYSPPGELESMANKIKYKNGYVYVTGYVYLPSTFHDFATVKYNAVTGAQVWERRYNNSASNSTDDACCVEVDNNNNVFVGGSSGGLGTSYDYTVIKYNSSGNLVWINRYDTSGTQFMYDMKIDNNSNIYSTGNGVGDYLTVKYDSTGIRRWFRYYNSGGINGDEAKSIFLDTQNQVYITGNSHYPNPIKYDITTIKYNSNGIQQWVVDYNSSFSHDDFANIIKVDSSNNVYVAGVSYEDNINKDFVLLKYSQLTGIRNLHEDADKFELSQNYPNPFNAVTKIKFANPKNSFVKLSVFDLLGREITVLVNCNLQSGKYEINFDGTNYSSGIYFYRLIASNNMITKKLILSK